MKDTSLDWKIILVIIFLVVAVFEFYSYIDLNFQYQNYKQESQQNISNLNFQIENLSGKLNLSEQILLKLNDFYACGYGGICVNKSVGNGYIQTPYEIPLSNYQKDFYYKISSGIEFDNNTDDVTFSMFPTFTVGNWLAIIPINKDNLNSVHVGDIIIYKLETPLNYKGQTFTKIVHRVILISPDYKTFQTKGDNNLIPDSPINSTQIIGKVVGILY